MSKCIEVRGGMDPENEVCACGALRSEHADGFSHKDSHDTAVMHQHKGPCVRTGCKQFVWDHFVNADKARLGIGVEDVALLGHEKPDE